MGDSDETIFVYVLTFHLATLLLRSPARSSAPYYVTVVESREVAPRHASLGDEGFGVEEKLCWQAHNPYYFVHFWSFAPDAAQHLFVARFHLISRFLQIREALADARVTGREERDVYRELMVNAEQSWVGSDYRRGATCRECYGSRKTLWWMVHNYGHSDIVLLV